jgi:ligand-binding sensor domain-containing protein
MLPSQNVLCVFTDGSTQWYGTDEGLARHKGTQAKLNWESFYVTDGLVNNTVQCINKDLNGRIWIGTPAGVSVFNGTQWKSYTKADGLVDNHVLCIANDLDGTLWFGTANGVSAFDGTKWTNYIAD